jgi:hypothetical protein
MIRGRSRLVLKFVVEEAWALTSGLQHLCSEDTVILGDFGSLGRSAIAVDMCILGLICDLLPS